MVLLQLMSIVKFFILNSDTKFISFYIYHFVTVTFLSESYFHLYMFRKYFINGHNCIFFFFFALDILGHSTISALFKHVLPFLEDVKCVRYLYKSRRIFNSSYFNSIVSLSNFYTIILSISA